ncbi:MAG: ribonuclease P protein component [Patescibacteria group bacterium]|jgi:ribonuclease P protein component
MKVRTHQNQTTMLSQLNRLKTDRDFQRIFKSGRFVSGSFLTLKFSLNKLPASRFAFVVGVKVSKRAVKRNLLRRRMREIVRKRLPDIKTGFDAVLMAKPEALKLDFPQLESEVRRTLIKSGLLPPSR